MRERRSIAMKTYRTGFLLAVFGNVALVGDCRHWTLVASPTVCKIGTGGRIASYGEPRFSKASTAQLASATPAPTEHTLRASTNLAAAIAEHRREDWRGPAASRSTDEIRTTGNVGSGRNEVGICSGALFRATSKRCSPTPPISTFARDSHCSRFTVPTSWRPNAST